MKKSSVFLAALSALIAVQSTSAISFTGNYSQNFDTLASSGTPTWLNDSTLPGWYLFNTAGSALTSYVVGTGSSGTGNFYSFGSIASTERALGGVGSGSFTGYIAVALQNSSGISFGSITLSFDGEQWRNGGNASLASQAMQLQYGFGGSFAGVSTWNTPGGNFDWSSPVNAASAGAVDGNVAGLVPNRGGTLSGLSWNNGDTLWLRWIENNDAGNDHGLAIDNLSISASAASAPEQTSTLALAMIGVFGCLAFGRRIQHLA